MEHADQQDIQITAQPLGTPALCKFTLNKILFNGTVSCKSAELAQDSLLLKALFDLPEVREVLVSHNTLTVATHSPRPDWKSLGKTIGTLLRTQLGSGKDLIPSDWGLAGQPLSQPAPAAPFSPEGANLDSPEALEVQNLLRDQINPAVASHGGQITLVDFKDGIVYLKMEGGCQGCGQANLTLRQGVEKAIKQAVPSVKAVVDITDHESGANPYY